MKWELDIWKETHVCGKRSAYMESQNTTIFTCIKSNILHLEVLVESCRTYEWVMSLTNESCHIWARHVGYESEHHHNDISNCLHLKCDMTQSYLTWLIRKWNNWFICAIWLIHMCDMTRSYVRHDSIICATWLIHKCDMTHFYVRYDSFICTTWLIHCLTHTHVT